MTGSAADHAKAAMETQLAYWRARVEWSDSQFLSDYCHQRRLKARGQAMLLEDSLRVLGGGRVQGDDAGLED